MRLLPLGVFAAGLLAAGSALAQQCAMPADKAAFDVTGLKSQLMVIALTCDVRDKYNAFVTKFRPQLQREDTALNSYFRRAFGRRATQQHDDYITSLANAQSQNGLQRGTLFCSENVGMFDEVLSLPANADLATYAGGKGLVQPVSLVACAPKPTQTTRTAQATRSTVRR
jgi:hypothetical protein